MAMCMTKIIYIKVIGLIFLLTALGLGIDIYPSTVERSYITLQSQFCPAPKSSGGPGLGRELDFMDFQTTSIPEGDMTNVEMDVGESANGANGANPSDGNNETIPAMTSKPKPKPKPMAPIMPMKENSAKANAMRALKLLTGSSTILEGDYGTGMGGPQLRQGPGGGGGGGGGATDPCYKVYAFGLHKAALVMLSFLVLYAPLHVLFDIFNYKQLTKMVKVIDTVYHSIAASLLCLAGLCLIAEGILYGVEKVVTTEPIAQSIIAGIFAILGTVANVLSIVFVMGLPSVGKTAPGPSVRPSAMTQSAPPPPTEEA